MAKHQLEKAPLTLAGARKIKNEHERNFAVAACLSPNLLVLHEPFDITNEHGTTLPDFLVINTRHPQPKHNFFEVTGNKTATGERKLKQGRVMSQAVRDNPNLRYYQFTRRTMLNIARRAAKDETDEVR